MEQGDCLYKFATEYTGDGNRYPELAAVNGLENQELLIPGQMLRIPEEWLALE